MTVESRSQTSSGTSALYVTVNGLDRPVLNGTHRAITGSRDQTSAVSSCPRSAFDAAMIFPYRCDGTSS